VAAKRFGGSLAGTITLTAGLGGMGGAQPLAVTMNGGGAIWRGFGPLPGAPPVGPRLRDLGPHPTRAAPRPAEAAAGAGEALSIGLLGNAADVLPELLTRGAPINVVTDQTSAHDPLTYLPRGVAFDDMPALRAEDPAGFTARARESMAAHVEAMVGFQDGGAEVFDYGNSIRGEAELAGYARAFAFPGFVRWEQRRVGKGGEGWALPISCRAGWRSTTCPRCGPRTRPGSPPGPGSRWPPTWRPWSASRTGARRCSTTATRSAARPSWPGTPARSPSRGS